MCVYDKPRKWRCINKIITTMVIVPLCKHTYCSRSALTHLGLWRKLYDSTMSQSIPKCTKWCGLAMHFRLMLSISWFVRTQRIYSRETTVLGETPWALRAIGIAFAKVRSFDAKSAPRISRKTFDLELPNFIWTSIPTLSTALPDMTSLSTSGLKL